jgi:hypothetical protein
MKRTGSENLPQDPPQDAQDVPGEPIERARLLAEVAKQRVRIAKDELKRARKRLKEAKREAKIARKQSASARKDWKRAKRNEKLDDNKPKSRPSAKSARRKRPQRATTRAKGTGRPAKRRSTQARAVRK